MGKPGHYCQNCWYLWRHQMQLHPEPPVTTDLSGYPCFVVPEISRKVHCIIFRGLLEVCQREKTVVLHLYPSCYRSFTTWILLIFHGFPISRCIQLKQQQIVLLGNCYLSCQQIWWGGDSISYSGLTPSRITSLVVPVVQRSWIQTAALIYTALVFMHFCVNK